MSCDCGQCKQHYKTLGLTFGIPSEAEILEAYKEGVKQWHPDLYENFATLRADAEEHFKEIQIAYREIREHSGGAADSPSESTKESPREAPRESPRESPRDPAWEVPRESPARGTYQRSAEAPAISFGGARGCFVGPKFPPAAEEIISRYLGKLGTAIAIVDLGGSFNQFVLLAQLGIVVRDARNIVSLLWYKDLGEMNLIEKHGKPSMWQNLVGGAAGSQAKQELEIGRNNGTLFFSISSQAEDSVKKVIYDFLLNAKRQAQP
jgi:hypothetical protein